MKSNILTEGKEIESGSSNRVTILKIINSFPGIRYRDILRLTNLNNGTISHHLSALEKCSVIKISRTENSNITRYYPASTPSDETLILNFLKIKTTKSIIQMLQDAEEATFGEIVEHIHKAPSTTSWNLKRLMDSKIVGRKRGENVSLFFLYNKDLVKKLIAENNKTLLDRSIDNYISIIDEL
ncbi:MAG: winged helix-turn-helix transcriptional regulator [Candidatus Nitrosocosmicus sp.]|jgi:predicted transcriptional regulator|uniref:winged helix-turn-helix transcriptional regulator n=1 Tax=Candidatus Nitrosocosmicus agrestis TaxID=2563600 RepID=UPI00122DE494|nr:winged helix-turn-helix transcriptional regulator [Candidatus Nitrosocosmicus sp. SS]KAA2282129.1 winged helix-turn-helix transcriptional regulator [Candidatus Nitrosocosmicus sp. SS]KAF0870026.1 winged helix-turn-helix transcriptional regulator [Candidatus Nitrosocosmicus sp. SS]MDR4492398.1 winged helix-turn-helix transcriptional regulator [Candidatus Nitrosocosmicus sp.]HET6591125.1 winged helix-turn-helix transcriptional regulator [Candidatus Nitrosocosmicus sp.]